MLVVLDGRGTRTLRGPGTFTPGGPAQASARPTAIGALTTSSPQRRARIGAVRSVGTGVARSPTIWHVDVTKSATICLADPTNVMLWRADASKPATMTITRVRDGAKRDIKWQTGASTMVWPADLTIGGDSEYRLAWAGAPAPTSLRFRTLSTKPAGLEDMASSLIQNGCNAQLDLLIETVKLPEDATPAG